MPTITIPKNLAKNDDLVVIPRKEYEALVRRKNTEKKPIDSNVVVKRSPSFRVAKKHEKFYDTLDQELTEALRDVEAGNVYGPFETVEEMRKSLES